MSMSRFRRKSEIFSLLQQSLSKPRLSAGQSVARLLLLFLYSVVSWAINDNKTAHFYIISAGVLPPGAFLSADARGYYLGNVL